MRSLLLVATLAVASARSLDGDVALFADFKATYGRQYSPSQEAKALSCFRENLNKIDELNALGGEMHGVNQFTDMCATEFKSFYHNMKPRTTKPTAFFPTLPLVDANATVDWRNKGAVTHVKNQGQCGSCWSFSATGNMEGQNFLQGTKSLVALSEEELVQCSKNGNQGCNGGLMDNAFEWVVSNKGIDSESSYPYTSGGGVTGDCKKDKLPNHVAKFSGHKDVQHDEDQMAAWTAANGPLSIAVDAGMGWQTYIGGVKKTCYAGQLDHGVMIVGYGTAGSTPYWIVKNSWGASWGEHGYIRLERGKNCNGLKEQPSSATV